MTLRSVAFLANAHSPHLADWVRLLKQRGHSIVTYTLHREGVASLVDTLVVSLLPRLWRGLPSWLAYAVAGVLLRSRWQRSFDHQFVHVHGASGYGLVALLAGIPFILTTHGSEIFEARRRGRLYSSLIQWVLRKALHITGTSEAMKQCLMSSFGVPEERLSIFSLGCSELFVFSESLRNETRQEWGVGNQIKVFITTRRVHPRYNTLALVRSFAQLAPIHSDVRLVLLEGECDDGYRDEVRREVNACAQISLIPGFVTQERVRALLCASDYFISIPNSDQLSSSILEAAACLNVPLLVDIPAYAPLFEMGAPLKVEDVSESAIFNALKSACELSSHECQKRKFEFQLFCSENYSKAHAAICLDRIYSLHEGAA